MKRVLGLLVFFAAVVRSETKTWQGGDGAFSAPGQWVGGTVPLAGDSVIISNGAVTVTSSDSFTGLVSVVLGESGKLVCNQSVETVASVTFTASNALEVSAGELVIHGFASGTGFVKEGPGAVRLSGRDSGVSTLAPGLREGRLEGAFNLTSPNLGTRVSAALEKANTAWPADHTNTTVVYTGEIYLDGSPYSFAESIDDNVVLLIGGASVLSNQSYSTVSTGAVQLAAGWHPVELRVGNSSGSGGSLNVFATGGGVAWKKADTAWQVLRDIDGGGFLRSPGRLATDFSGGVTVVTGTVAVCTETAADSAGTAAVNRLGGVTLNAGTLLLSNAACRATSFFGASNTLLRLDVAGLTLTNDTDCFHYGTTAGAGTWALDGAGRLQWAPRSATHYAHTATVVNNGTLSFGALPSVADYSFGTFTVNAPGTLETLVNGNTQFTSLWGDGTITNTMSTGGPYQLRIQTGPCAFAGQINGNIRYYSSAAVSLTGTNSQFTGNFAIHSSYGPGVTGAKKIGMAGQPSSIGKSAGIDIREFGGTLLYLGTGETTDKTLLLYPSANRAVIDGGLSGGVTFNGAWSTSGGRLVRLAVTGTHSAGPCVFSGAFNEHSLNGTNYSTYLAKEGPGTWVFKSHAGRANRGVVDVREGTLQFESLAEAGTICSLGRSDLLFSDTISSVTNGLGVPYAFSLGTAATVGTLEYIGTNAASCTTRKLVLQGGGRLKSDAGALSFLGGVQSLTAGPKTLYLAGSGTNTLGSVADGAGAVGITKEGAGTWALTRTNAFSEPLAVQAGQLVLDKRGYSYYRLNLLQRNYNITPTADTNIELTEFALYSADGVRRNLNLSKNGTNNTANLNPGEFCPLGSYPTYAGRNDINLFDNNANSQWTVNTAGILPGTPITLVMRLTNGTPEITGYDLQYWSASTNRYLSGWSLDGSRDGTAWETLDAVTNFFPVPPAVVGGGVKWWYSTGTATPGTGFAAASGVLTDAQLSPGVQVSVASGAQLTFLGGTEALSTLSVDCDAGGGTLSDLVVAETGQLRLTGSSLQSRPFAVPLTIGSISNAAALKNWSVLLNGEPAAGVAVRWNAADGTLWVYSFGTLISVN
jgi:hypothetical protein